MSLFGTEKGSKRGKNDPRSFGIPEPAVLSYFKLSLNDFCLHKCQNRQILSDREALGRGGGI